MTLLEEVEQPVYVQVGLGYLLGNIRGRELQVRTDKIQRWCTQHIGEPYTAWMFNYELPEDRLIFMSEESAILFKLMFKL